MSAGTRLARALEASARASGCTATVATASERPWASATFTGSRHTLTLTGAASPALGRWLADLARAELRVPGHLVADMTVEPCGAGAVIAALTLEA